MSAEHMLNLSRIDFDAGLKNASQIRSTLSALDLPAFSYHVVYKTRSVALSCLIQK